MEPNTSNHSVIDIGGSQSTAKWRSHIPDALKGNRDLAKELLYVSGMDQWNAIAETSYQTSEELEIIGNTAEQVVHDLPSPIRIIDLGAANSLKFAPYVRACLNQGKEVEYIPLDLSFKSLVDQVARARLLFPELMNNVRGLWGSFEDGDKYYKEIDGSRLFLSLGSIFFNAPEDMCDDRCMKFRKNLGPNDRLVVGQDSPYESGSVFHSFYTSPAYNAFMTQYLKQLHECAGIKTQPTEAWGLQSKMEHGMHFFAPASRQRLVCTAYGNYVIKRGTIYKLFKSWKRGEDQIMAIAMTNGLAISTLGKAEHSGMTQYLISAEL